MPVFAGQPAVAQGTAASSQKTDMRSGTLRIGMDYVVPAFVAGSKVRTAEEVDTALAERIADRLDVRPEMLDARGASAAQLLHQNKADVVLAAVVSSTAAQPGAVLVPTGYTVGPMAIMRSDTDIKLWAHLKGRTVCLSEGSRYIGTMSARYAAVEKVFKAPADSLLALRTGVCDAAVHDSGMLNELLKLPEWKKFSARLPSGSRVPLAFSVATDDENTIRQLKQVAKEWAATHYFDKLAKARARDIAFEVYLDQNIPDCH